MQWRQWRRISGAAVLALSVQTTAGVARGASDRVEIERSATSPNAELRVVVEHLGRVSTELVVPSSAACRMKITLHDELSGDVIWTREHSVTRTRDGSGAAVSERRASATPNCNPLVWIHDAGHVVLSSGAETMTVFHPDDGSIVLEFDLLRCFPDEDHEEFIRQTTVGPLWASNSRRFFLDVEHSRKVGGARTYFVVRPWWERHVVIDLDAGEVVRLAGMPEAEFLVNPRALREQDLMDAIDENDRAWVTNMLKLGANWRSAYVWWVPAAAHMAGRLEMEEAIPWLRLYEDADYVGTWSSTWREFTLRQTVQLSLRRLGALPGDLPATEIGDFTGDVPRPFRNAASRTQRVWNTRHVREGMPVKELVQLIGHPDYIALPMGHVLDYDIDRGGEPFTLRITLVDVDSEDGSGRSDRRVESIERITPPIWQDSNQRDVSVTNRRNGPADPNLRTREIGARKRSGRQR